MNLSEAKEYLAMLGISMPDKMIQALIERIDSVKDCLEKNYSLGDIYLIYGYLIALMGGAQSGKYVSSHAVSGAVSQSFSFKDSGVLFSSQLALLRALDKKGCVSSLIPENPFAKAKGFIMSVKSKCQGD